MGASGKGANYTAVKAKQIEGIDRVVVVAIRKREGRWRERGREREWGGGGGV